MDLTSKKQVFLAGLAAGVMVTGIGGLAISGCGSSGGGELATINGEPITMKDFHRYLEYKPEVTVVTQTGAQTSAAVADTLAFQGLQDLLRQKLLLQLAKDNGVYPSDQDVLAELEFQKKREPNFLRGLQSRGLSVGEIKDNLRIDLARERLITKGLKVDLKEAEDYIKKNPKEFVDPATADMQWIVVKDDISKKPVDDALKTGQAFSVVASNLSQSPDAKRTTRFPMRLVDQMPAQIQQIVFSTKEAAVTDWVKLSDGWAKFYLEKFTPEKPIEMTDVRKQFVQRQIAIKRGMQATDIDKQLLDKLKESKIDIKYDDVKERWKEAFDSLKETGGGIKNAPAAPAEEKK